LRVEPESVVLEALPGAVQLGEALMAHVALDTVSAREGGDRERGVDREQRHGAGSEDGHDLSHGSLSSSGAASGTEAIDSSRRSREPSRTRHHGGAAG